MWPRRISFLHKCVACLWLEYSIILAPRLGRPLGRRQFDVFNPRGRRSSPRARLSQVLWDGIPGTNDAPVNQTLLFCWIANGGVPVWGRSPAQRKVWITLIDGLGPDYIAKSEMPNLRRAIKAGAYTVWDWHDAVSDQCPQRISLLPAPFPRSTGSRQHFLRSGGRGNRPRVGSRSTFRLPPSSPARTARDGRRDSSEPRTRFRSLIGTEANLSICAEKQGIPMYEAENKLLGVQPGPANSAPAGCGSALPHDQRLHHAYPRPGNRRVAGTPSRTWIGSWAVFSTTIRKLEMISCAPTMGMERQEVGRRSGRTLAKPRHRGRARCPQSPISTRSTIRIWAARSM
jgi:hypothetical protein